MEFFNKYPYTDFHEINLDWIIEQIKKNTEDIKVFINLNTIKYANPIGWDITSQYEANTVVIDEQTGNAFISTKAVPNGVHLSNTDYWTQIYNYADNLKRLRQQIAITDEGASSTATAPRSIGDLVWLNELLYKVTAPMIAGDAYVVGSNCEKTTIEDELKNVAESVETEIEPKLDALENAINQEILDRESADDELKELISKAGTRLVIDVTNPPEGLTPMDGESGSSIDNTPAFNAIIDYAKNHGRGIVFFPVGSYYFGSKPNSIQDGVSLIGTSYARPALVKNYEESTPSNGFITLESNSTTSTIKNLSLMTDKAGGSAIKFNVTQNSAPDYVIIDKVNITAFYENNIWDYGIFADGSARNSAPIGIRDLYVNKVDIFSCKIESIHAISLEGCHVVATSCFATTGGVSLVNIDAVPGVISSYSSFIFGYLRNLRMGQNGEVSDTTLTCNTLESCAIGAPCSRCRINAIQIASLTNSSRSTSIFSDETEVKGAIGATIQTAAGSKAGHIGKSQATLLPNQKHMNISSDTHFFVLQTGAGQICVVVAEYSTENFTFLSNASGVFSSDPESDSVILLSKSSNSHDVTITNKTGYDTYLSILCIGNIGSISDPI